MAKLSPTQRTVLAEVDWRGPDTEFLYKSTYVRTLNALVRRGLITMELSEDGRVWKCSLTDKGLYVWREAVRS